MERTSIKDTNVKVNITIATNQGVFIQFTMHRYAYIPELNIKCNLQI